MRLLVTVLTPIAGALLLAACSTADKREVVSAPVQPQVSASIRQQQQLMSEYGAVRTLKRKVAIARFSNETNYGRSFLVDESFDPIGKQALDILSTKLQQTEKFILLERADLDRINAELSLANRGQLRTVADYLILGSITEFGRKTEGESGVFSRTKRQIAYAKVTLRLVDIYTGEVIYADEGYGEALSEVGTTLGLGTRAGYDSTLNDKAIDAAISHLASNVIENLLERKWRSYLLAYDDGSYIIGGGKAQGLEPGDRLRVLSKGRTITNPQTGVEVTLPGDPVAVVEVTAFAGEGQLSEIAFTRLVEGTLPTDADESVYADYVVEELSLKN